MRRFWRLPLKDLHPAEWEALCDRCGKCCRAILDSDTNTMMEGVACRLLDLETNQCSNYRKRFSALKLEDGYRCHKVTMHLLESRPMPETCAYGRRFRDEPLEDWQIETAKANYGNGG